jgi:hypothetical protein
MKYFAIILILLSLMFLFGCKEVEPKKYKYSVVLSQYVIQCKEYYTPTNNDMGTVLKDCFTIVLGVRMSFPEIRNATNVVVEEVK